MECLFCKIAKKEIPSSKIYEDKDFYAFLDINPVNKGHTLLVPKKHCSGLLDFPEFMETRFMEVSKKIAEAVVKATKADGFNLGMNNGKAAGQAIFHAHFHIIPRFEADGHIHWEHGKYKEGEIEEYAKKITKHL